MIHYDYKNIRGTLPHRIARVIGVGIIRGGLEHAMLTDLRTRGEFFIPVSSPNHIRPQVGDIWMVGSDYGAWAFKSLVSSVKGPPSLTLNDTMRVLTDLGLIDYDPQQSPVSAGIEAPHAAYIGEVREFAVIPAGWLECNGQAVSRARYARLFDSIGTTFGSGDGSTTFNLPTYTMAFPTIKKSICAY